MKALVIVPTYNEIENLPLLTPAILGQGDAYHLLVADGSRWVPGGGTENWSLLRKFISRGGSLYAKTILGVPVNDLTSGFKCFSSYVLRDLDLDSIHSNGYGFQVEVNYRCHRLGYR